jgi:hypothetical protein
VTVAATTSRHTPATVHNLTVADLHTYSVLAGSHPVLTHNASPCVKPPGSVGLNQHHVFQGEINKKGKAVGFHHRPAGANPPSARIVPGTATPADANGLYQANVEILNPATGTWVRKGPPSTFFPDSWSQTRVVDEIRGAYANGTVQGSSWRGVSPSGVPIRGYLDQNGDIVTAFPVMGGP